MEHIELPSKAFVHTEKDTGFYIKGFASIEGIDRDGDNIPVKAFQQGISQFTSNPQLWLDHRKVMGEDGIEGSIGVVEKMLVVRVEKTPDTNNYQIIDMETEQPVDSFEDGARFLVKDGDKGLWVVAKVNRPAVADRIKGGELNAFSWSGMLMRSPDGKIKSVDIHEVSVVFLPANQRALFMIGKNFGEGEQDFAAMDAGLVPLEENPALKASEQGSTFAFLKMGANGAYHITYNGEITDLETAEVVAEKIAETAAQVALFKNRWKATSDGHQVYRALRVFEGGTKQMDAMRHLQPNVAASGWSQRYIDDLPDECFGFIEHGGRKDAEGKTVPRSLRKYAFKDHELVVSKQALERAVREALHSPDAEPALTCLLPYAKEKNTYPYKDGVIRDALTDAEQKLLGVYGELALVKPEGKEAEEQQAKGGENMAELQDILDAIDGMKKELGERVEALETESKAIKETAAEKEQAEKAQADADKLNEVLEAVKALKDEFSERIETLENTSKGSTQPDEGDKNADTDMADELLKKLTPLLGEDAKKSLLKKSLDDSIMSGILGTHSGNGDRYSRFSAGGAAE